MPKKTETQSIKKPSQKPKIKRPNINLLSSMIVLVLVLGVLLFQLQQKQEYRGRAQITNCDVTSAQMQITPEEQKLFNDINTYRQQNGKDRLTWDQTLNRSAAWMSRDMITGGRVGHMDSLGRTEEQRFPACGVSNTRNYGETVVSGANAADEILAGWKIDPVDAAVLLNSTFTVGAIAAEVDPTGNVAYWTFNASGPPTTTPTAGPPPTDIPIVTEGSLVPSPQCLGQPCPTNPGGNPVFTTTPRPSVPGQPSITPPSSTPVPGGNGGTPGGGNVTPGGGGGAVTPTIFGATGAPGSGGGDPTTNPSGIQYDPSGNPITPNPSGGSGGGPGGGSGGGSGGGNGGFFGLFLAFLALIIKFFLTLLGKA